MKKKRILSALLAVACFIASGVMIYREWDGRKPVPILMEQNVITLSPTPNKTAIETAYVSPQARSNSSNQPATSSEFGYITVCGKTFPVKKGIDEKTLKHNIGWMESSARFGEDGICILMGHRDRQFRILRKIAKGDVIVLTDSDGNKFNYTVQSAKIVESDAALRFPAGDGKRLMLVTCYPFYWVGHAPQKFCIEGHIIS